MSTASVRPFDNRFAYTLFLALAIHALIILTFAFTITATPVTHPTMEVTLAHIATTKENADADFLAQMNQLGSGESDAVKKLANDTNISKNNSESEHEKEGSTASAQPSSQQQVNQDNGTTDSLLNNNYDTLNIVISFNADSNVVLAQRSAQTSSSEQQPRNQEQSIAALQAQIELRRELMAKAPKRRIISALSTKSDSDAAYLDSWRRRIEDVGNIHYPQAANEQRLYGSLRLSVAINSDGRLQSIEILKPSGSLILDNAAIKIVKLAAPFPPFPLDMQRKTDILEIIRTWKFEKTNRLY